MRELFGFATVTLTLAHLGCGSAATVHMDAAVDLVPPPAADDMAPAPDLSGPPQCDPPRPGDPTGSDFVTDDGVRAVARIPPNYQASQPSPLIVVFAPAGADAILTEQFTGLTPPATARGYIITYVDHVTPTSNAAIETAARVIPYVTGMWCVDPQRIYLTGHSDGGSITEITAARALYKIAAAAPSAAGANAAVMMRTGCPPSPLAEMEIHSSGDRLFPVTQGFGADVAAWWSSCDGCNPTPSDPDANNCIVYSGCGGGTEVRYCEGSAAHGVWPRLNTQMLDFFGRFRAP